MPETKYERRKLYGLHLREKHSSGSVQPVGSATSEVYVFFRAEGFYPLELAGDDEARLNAENNPGTLRVENLNGETVWPNNIIRSASIP